MSSEGQQLAAPGAYVELQERFERLQRDFAQFREHLPEAFLEMNLPEMRVTFMSQVALALFGFAREDVDAGIMAVSLVDAASFSHLAAAAAQHFAGTVDNGLPYQRQPGQHIFEVTLVRKDGSAFPADLQASYILDDARAPVGVRYILRDTTRRVQAEAERARLAALVEWSEDAIVSRDLDGTVLSWNAGAERLYGYSAAEMVGRPPDIIEAPEVGGQLAQALADQVAGVSRQIETRRRTRDGRMLDVSVSLFPVKDAQGEVVAVGGIGRDIGGRIRQERALERSNQMLSALGAAQTRFIRDGDPSVVFEGLLTALLNLTGSSIGIIGRVAQAGDEPGMQPLAFAEGPGSEELRAFIRNRGRDGLLLSGMCGPCSRVVASGDAVITPEPGRERCACDLEPDHPPLDTFMGLPIHAGTAVVGLAVVANRPGGYTRADAAALAPLLSACGTIIEAMRMEEARRAAEQQLDLALRGADLALWEWDVQGRRISSKSPPSATHLGLPGDASIDEFTALLHPADRDMVSAAFARHAAGETPLIECETRVIRGDGELRWMLTRGTIVERGPQGQPLRGAGTFLDITERRLADEERIRLEQQVRQSQKLESLGVFAGGIAHDFNNLLTAVLGNLFLLEDGLTEDQRELLGDARLAAERGAEVVRRLLTFARPEVSGAETVQLDSLLRETAALARSALTPSVRLVVQHSPGDPLVRGSWTSLQQVLVNLMVNARDAMPGGGTITVARRIEAVGPRHRWAPPDLPRGRYHMVTVTDTGEGIAPEHVDRIFDPFFTTKGVGRGSGLGLPTALGIARAHGGWLAAETAPGNGTTFRLLLPVLSAA
ncbi:MAG: PAS domain S-box protein [Dehalococcoidia bacterium]|nr:PAS domain S-box protein [Dehalococcoidia bacterium]